MLKIYPYQDLGSHDYGWLKARYHFSFGEYYNPNRTSFGNLRVINDDIIQPKTGFGTHPHKDMEIITFVKQGAITHEDSKGNKGVTSAGNVQVMSAGTGIFHSEFNKEDGQTSLYQIWITPKEKNIVPNWDMAEFPKAIVDPKIGLNLLVSGRKKHQNNNQSSDASRVLYIHQEASIYGGIIKEGDEIKANIEDNAYILVASGEIQIEGKTLKTGDGAEITAQKSIIIKALQTSQVILIDVP